MSERLWAPWRMEFIRQSEKPAGCALCEYATLEPSRQSRVLVQTREAFVVLNKYPYVAGHLLVVPKAHVAHPKELEPDVHHALFRLVTASVEALERAVAPDGVNLGVNLGRAAGAGIHDHLHVHVVPRWQGDNNFMPVIGDVRVMPEYLEATWVALAPSFAGLGGGTP